MYFGSQLNGVVKESYLVITVTLVKVDKQFVVGKK